jgi:hypothetical protein
MVKKMDKVDGPDVDKTEWMKLEFLIDPDNPASNNSQHFVIFQDGFPGEGIKWMMAFCEIENLMPMKESAENTRMFQTLLKGQALSNFEHYLRESLEVEDSDDPDNELIELMFRDIDIEYIPNRTIRLQKYHMRGSMGFIYES